MTTTCTWLYGQRDLSMSLWLAQVTTTCMDRGISVCHFGKHRWQLHVHDCMDRGDLSMSLWLAQVTTTCMDRGISVCHFSKHRWQLHDCMDRGISVCHLVSTGDNYMYGQRDLSMSLWLAQVTTTCMDRGISVCHFGKHRWPLHVWTKGSQYVTLVSTGDNYMYGQRISVCHFG